MLWLKEKAIKRYTNLYDNNRLNGETLYYRKMVQMTWDEAKNTYLGEVGR
jgi:hypothetical protein